MSASNEADRTADISRLAGRHYVGLPTRRKETFPILIVGIGVYCFALGLMWIMGSILVSGIIAALGTGLIIADLHLNERARTGG